MVALGPDIAWAMAIQLNRMGRHKTLADRFRWYWKISNRLEGLQVRRTGTSGIAVIRRSPALVLETVGKRTGRRRRTPLMYWTTDDHFFIGGGAAGMSRVDWVANLRSNPEAAVWVKRRRIPVVGRELRGEEYEAAKSHAFRLWPNAAKYERSGRPIPYFRLERKGGVSRP